MIKNERQYKITRAQVERFERAAADRAEEPPQSDVHPLLVAAAGQAIKAQLEELRAEILEYEALRDGRVTVLKLDSIDDLPGGLIRARIAAGITHKELAERLGVPEQQVQRYEATDYATLTLPRLAEVARALGVSIREELFLPNARVSTKTVLERLESLGVNRSFAKRRLMPASARRGTTEEGDDTLALRTASNVARIFGVSVEDIFSSRALALPAQSFATARFKKAARGNQNFSDAYAVYAHYLCGIVKQATPSLTVDRVPTNAAEMRQAILLRYRAVTFESVLRYAWSIGVAVVPLSDSGAFHGAFWRSGGRNLVVLKQKTRSLARWLFDLLHELFHAGQEPELAERTILEADNEIDAVTGSNEEQHAMQFAGDVVLDGRAQALAEECVHAAGGKVERLKQVVPLVASRNGVDVGCLANYIAFRLSLNPEPINWWGTASNLQNFGADPFRIASDILLEQIKFSRLNEQDRCLLAEALGDESE